MCFKKIILFTENLPVFFFFFLNVILAINSLVHLSLQSKLHSKNINTAESDQSGCSLHKSLISAKILAFLLHHEGTVRSFGKLSRYFSRASPTPFQCMICKLFPVHTHSKPSMSGYVFFCL